jgi:hypothetical protein
MSPKRRPKRGAPGPRPARGKPSDEARPRRWLGIGAAGALAGLMLVGTGESDLGTALTIAGAFLMIYAIHTFGRLGPATP